MHTHPSRNGYPNCGNRTKNGSSATRGFPNVTISRNHNTMYHIKNITHYPGYISSDTVLPLKFLIARITQGCGRVGSDPTNTCIFLWRCTNIMISQRVTQTQHRENLGGQFSASNCFLPALHTRLPLTRIVRSETYLRRDSELFCGRLKLHSWCFSHSCELGTHDFFAMLNSPDCSF